LRRDTLSHAYELLKVADPKKRKKLADMVARGELSLVKLRERIDEAPRAKRVARPASTALGRATIEDALEAETEANWPGTGPKRALSDNSLIAVRAQLADSITELIAIIQSDVVKAIDETDRQNLIKFLMISRVRLENAIGLVRRGNSDR
jgi:hypothetical protein